MPPYSQEKTAIEARMRGCAGMQNNDLVYNCSNNNIINNNYFISDNLTIISYSGKIYTTHQMILLSCTDGLIHQSKNTETVMN